MLILISGSSGAGKNTIIDHLMQRNDNIRLLQSCTTRKRRKNEKENAYIYLSKEEFDEKLKNGEIFENEEIHQNFYGILNSSLQEVLKEASKNIHYIKDVGVLGQINLSRELKKKKIPVLTIFIQVPRAQLIERLKKENRHQEIPDELKKLTDKYAYKSKIPADLCYLDGEEMEKYMHDMRICQEFAVRNRKKIADEIIAFLKIRKFSSFETVHNFIDDKGIIRKGAVPARLGQKILIPMNMRDGCLVCIGKGNEDWNCSAPHGAGRICSRSEAKKLLSVEEFQNAMEGIYTTTATESTLDEAPQAYKPAQSIMNLISPTAEIIEVIKPVYNFKAAE